MNATQIKYARERATAIYKSRSDALRTKHTTPAVTLSNEDKLIALKAGEFTVVKTLPRNCYGYMSDFVNFNVESTGKFNEKAFDREFTTLTARYQKLLDDLVLGDSAEAVKALEAFASETATHS